jgi:hypothetical protein
MHGCEYMGIYWVWVYTWWYVLLLYWQSLKRVTCWFFGCRSDSGPMYLVLSRFYLQRWWPRTRLVQSSWNQHYHPYTHSLALIAGNCVGSVGYLSRSMKRCVHQAVGRLLSTHEITYTSILSSSTPSWSYQLPLFLTISFISPAWITPLTTVFREHRD